MIMIWYLNKNWFFSKNPFLTFIVFRRACGLFTPRSFSYLFTCWFKNAQKKYFFLFQSGIRAAIPWLLKAFHHVYHFYDNSKWWVSQDIWHINQKLLSKIAFKVFLAAVSWPQRHSTRVSGVSDSPTSGIQMFLNEFRRHKSKKMAILLGTVSRYIFEDWNPNLCLRDINQIPYIKSYIYIYISNPF